jgi:hypothetical protein
VAKAKNSESKCSVSKEDFKEHAKPVAVTVGGSTLAAMPKEFSTGSFGWYVSGKVVITVGGVPVPVQVGMNLTVVGSKPVKPKE